MMMKRGVMTMMMIIINRQPVIKWCLTGTSALWDSSECRHTWPVDRYEVRLEESEQARYPSMHWERGREISAADESGKLDPPSADSLSLHLCQTCSVLLCYCFSDPLRPFFVFFMVETVAMTRNQLNSNKIKNYVT